MTSSLAPTVTFRFVGNSLAWIAQKGPGGGLARVWLDGKNMGLVSLFSPKVLWQQRVWWSGLLAQKSHTVTISWTGLRVSGHSGHRDQRGRLRHHQRRADYPVDGRGGGPGPTLVAPGSGAPAACSRCVCQPSLRNTGTTRQYTRSLRSGQPLDLHRKQSLTGHGEPPLAELCGCQSGGRTIRRADRLRLSPVRATL